MNNKQGPRVLMNMNDSVGSSTSIRQTNDIVVGNPCSSIQDIIKSLHSIIMRRSKSSHSIVHHNLKELNEPALTSVHQVQQLRGTTGKWEHSAFGHAPALDQITPPVEVAPVSVIMSASVLRTHQESNNDFHDIDVACRNVGGGLAKKLISKWETQAMLEQKYNIFLGARVIEDQVCFYASLSAITKLQIKYANEDSTRVSDYGSEDS
ncbi:hypothetical protein V6N13_094082 [Hibiscus sabdariffa]|uniref:Uncharacterized protein n=1 Tax=Hibiscus sabdariffa TaxID=183260 RepID=A0ABR2BKA2_9ROSI